MEITLGPVLALQGADDDKWSVSVLVVYRGEDPPPEIEHRLAHDAAYERMPHDVSETFENLGRGVRTVARYMLEVPLQDTPQIVTYRIRDHEEEWPFHVPGRDWAKLRVGHVSCNGFSHANKERDIDETKYERWEHLLERHSSEPLHILLFGGDQVYGDPIWDRATPIRHWAESDSKRKWTAQFTDDRRKATERFYGELYEDRWNVKPLRRALAQIPSLMMWDDHDIFDGWGSHPAKETESPVYKGIYAEASRFFRVFQLQNLGPHPGRQAICPEYNYTYGLKIGSTTILALDLRAQRREDRIISPDAWKKIYEWLDDNVEENSHLLVMASVPVVHLDFAALERTLAYIPGTVGIEDDFRDHWLSRPHKQERLRLIHRLFGHAQDKNVRVTILSGDIHVAGMGVVEDRRRRDRLSEQTTITQLISSPVVHPPPAKMILYVYDALNFFEREQEDDQGIYSRMVQLPAAGNRFIGQRNWLELELEGGEKNRIWANWFAEEEEHPYTAVVQTATA